MKFIHCARIFCSNSIIKLGVKNLIYNHVVPFRSLSAPLGSIALLQKNSIKILGYGIIDI